MRNLYFDLKAGMRQRLSHNKVGIDSQLRNNCIENVQKLFFSLASTTLQWMSNCCNARHAANSSSTWLIIQTRLVWDSDWHLISNTNFLMYFTKMTRRVQTWACLLMLLWR